MISLIVYSLITVSVISLIMFIFWLYHDFDDSFVDLTFHVIYIPFCLVYALICLVAFIGLLNGGN